MPIEYGEEVEVGCSGQSKDSAVITCSEDANGAPEFVYTGSLPDCTPATPVPGKKRSWYISFTITSSNLIDTA